MGKTTPYQFHSRYCLGAKDGEGHWKADGMSPRAETELVKRLSLIMIKRQRSETWKETPPKNRQYIRLDVGKSREEEANAEYRTEQHMYRALEATLHLKLDAICENVINELMEGEKSVIWVLSRKSVDIMATALEKAAAEKDVAATLRARHTRIFATHGETDIKARVQLCRTFMAHQGACTLISTMDALPESVSLAGASFEHYAQLHYLAGPMVQSENRPYLKGTTKLMIMYYLAKGTIDERMLRILLPRIKTLSALADEEDTKSMETVLHIKQKETALEMIARLCARASLGDADLPGEDLVD